MENQIQLPNAESSAKHAMKTIFNGLEDYANCNDSTKKMIISDIKFQLQSLVDATLMDASNAVGNARMKL